MKVDLKNLNLHWFKYVGNKRVETRKDLELTFAFSDQQSSNTRARPGQLGKQLEADNKVRARFNKPTDCYRSNGVRLTERCQQRTRA